MAKLKVVHKWVGSRVSCSFWVGLGHFTFGSGLVAEKLTSYLRVKNTHKMIK